MTEGNLIINNSPGAESVFLKTVFYFYWCIPGYNWLSGTLKSFSSWLLSFQPVVVLEIVSIYMHNLVELGLVVLHEVRPGSPLKPGKAPLQDTPYLQCVYSTTELGVLAGLLRVHSLLLSMSLTKMLNRASPNTDPWGTPLTAGLHFDIEPLTTVLGVQYPANSLFSEWSICQILASPV